jgi:hypothetical protein
MFGWTGNLKYIEAMTITDDIITGREILNKYIVTEIQNSRRNSRQLLCYDKILTVDVSVHSIFETEY